jgi:hypothetical protein
MEQRAAGITDRGSQRFCHGLAQASSSRTSYSHHPKRHVLALGTERVQEQQMGQQERNLLGGRISRRDISPPKRYRNSQCRRPAFPHVCRAILRSDATPSTPRETRWWGRLESAPTRYLSCTQLFLLPKFGFLSWRSFRYPRPYSR